MKIRVRDLWLILAGWVGLDVLMIATGWGSRSPADRIGEDLTLLTFLIAATLVALVGQQDSERRFR